MGVFFLDPAAVSEYPLGADWDLCSLVRYYGCPIEKTLS